MCDAVKAALQTPSPVFRCLTYATPMTTLASLLQPDQVILDIAVDNKTALFDLLGDHFAKSTGLNKANITASFAAREKVISTALGCGVAIPHGRIKNLRDTQGVFLRAKSGLAFDAPDGENVHLIFAMLVPEHATQTHLNLLSELAQMFSDEDFRARLMHVSDVALAHQLLKNWSPYAASEHSSAV